MSRPALLTPHYLEGRKDWYLSLPPHLSPTGKRRLEYFPTKAKAEARAVVLRKMEKQYSKLAAKASPDLIRDAIELNDLAQIHGYSGLREAFLTWAREHQIKSAAITFADLIKAHEEDFSANWSTSYTSGRWKPFVNLMGPIHDTPISLMDSDFWRDWLKKWRKKKSPAPATYNQILSIVRSLFKHEKARESLGSNPVENLPGLKDVRGEVCVSPPKEVARLLKWCEEHDREIIPYFVLGYFAGLRPIAEIQPLTFEQINFSARAINVITTKTHRNPRRQVPLEENAEQWLLPFKKCKGPICPNNLRKRLEKAKQEAKVTWGHDIMRHSYGSFWEAAHRDKAGCREQLSYNMGHTSFRTYEQKYRNDRTPEEAAKYWAILPSES